MRSTCWVRRGQGHGSFGPPSCSFSCNTRTRPRSCRPGFCGPGYLVCGHWHREGNPVFPCQGASPPRAENSATDLDALGALKFAINPQKNIFNGLFYEERDRKDFLFCLEDTQCQCRKDMADDGRKTVLGRSAAGMGLGGTRPQRGVKQAPVCGAALGLWLALPRPSLAGHAGLA